MGGFVLRRRVKLLRRVARCCARLRGGEGLVVVVEGEVEGELAVELRLESGVALPAGDGVGVDAEGLGDHGDGMAEEEEAGGGALDGFEGFLRARGSGFVLRRRGNLLRRVAPCCARLRGGDGECWNGR